MPHLTLTTSTSSLSPASPIFPTCSPHTQVLWRTIHIYPAVFLGRVADQHKSHLSQLPARPSCRLTFRVPRSSTHKFEATLCSSLPVVRCSFVSTQTFHFQYDLLLRPPLFLTAIATPPSQNFTFHLLSTTHIRRCNGAACPRPCILPLIALLFLVRISNSQPQHAVKGRGVIT